MGLLAFLARAAATGEAERSAATFGRRNHRTSRNGDGYKDFEE
jgi:hypothetical protein